MAKLCKLIYRKEDAENIYRDASELDLTTETDFVWLVSEEALQADNVPVGKCVFRICPSK